MEKLPYYHLKKPDSPKGTYGEALKRVEDVLKKVDPLPAQEVLNLLNSINSPKYLYWDQMRHKSLPKHNISGDEIWVLVRHLRNYNSIKTPIQAENGDHFRWNRLANTDQLLHRIDMRGGGGIFPDIPSSKKNQLIAHGIMEEAIASSQLEGAHTTRSVAKKMLIENRQPKNESEQMILNNYRAITAIDEEYRHSELSLDLMTELHSKLVTGTKAKSGKGRLRKDSDGIVVQGPIAGRQYVTHIPPKNAFLKKEIKSLIDFANDQDAGGFMHPIIKAIFLHFWIGYLHPFTDGNGRLARALFYWYLLRKDYRTIMYLPISTVIKKAPAQYAMAYILSEQDNSDLTYFYDFHMRKIMQSLDEFELYVKRKSEEKSKLDEAIGEKVILNERQNKLLHYLLSDKRASVTASSHSEINNISRQTAAKDLKELEGKKLLTSRREGKNVRYYASEKLKK